MPISLAGCGDGGDESNSANNNNGSDETYVSLCAETPDIDSWTGSAIDRVGEHYTLGLVAISPDPWAVGDNDWRIEVTDKEGGAVEGAALFVTPYMPDHGHGVSPPNYNGVLGEDGVYTVDTFNLIMPGFWEMTVTVSSDDLPTEYIAFRICVES